MAPLADPLIDDSEHPPRRTLLKKALLASGAFLGLALGALGLLYRAEPPAGSFGGALPALNTSLAGQANGACYLWTGGTCRVFNCNSARKASCVWGSCVCKSGCVDASGNCDHAISGYELVASNIRLRNVKYDQYLYTPRTWFMKQLRVESQAGKYADEWNVYRVPGTAFGKEYYLFSPTEYPTYAAGVTADRAPFQMSLTRVIVVDMSRNDQDPWGLFQYVCESTTHPGAWEISNFHDGGNGVKWYVHRGSWEVFGYFFGALVSSAKVGEGGEWMPDPPVSLNLPRCE